MPSRSAPSGSSATAALPVSIVIAVWGDCGGLEACLEALAAQRDADTQVIVVSNIPLPADFCSRHPWIDRAEASPALLIPHLWAIGMARSVHPIVAITTAHFIPAANYLSMLRRAHARLDAVGIGGAIDPPPNGDSVTWATYFLRYSTYLGWDSVRAVEDFAGDNASYKRAVLALSPDLVDQGFWEQRAHRALVERGHRLCFLPEIRLTLSTSFGVRRFCAQRFRHGLQFGRERVADAGVLARLVRIVSAPLIPLILLARIAGRVMRTKRYRGRFLRAFPILGMFVIAWSAGETAGYLTRSGNSADASASSARLA